jgi:hypothetical protein
MQRLILFTLLAAFVNLSACRTAKRSIRVDPQVASVKVSMLGVDPELDASLSIIWELTGCVPSVNGVKDPDGSVVFKSPSLKRLAVCQVKGQALEAEPQGITFSTAEKILYWSREVVIKEDDSGQFYAQARLQSVFQRSSPPGTTFRVDVPVVFSPQAGETLITATLDCSPPLLSYVATWKALPSPGEGVFEFAGQMNASTPAWTCARLWVSVDGVGQKYLGTWDPPASFTPSPTEVAKLAKVTLAPWGPRPPEPQGNVSVTTRPGSCAEGEIYNIATRKCEKESE